MKNHTSLTLRLSLLAVLVVGCASKPIPVKISSSSNAAEELTTQSQMIDAGYTWQTDVLAADDFNEAREYFSKAKRLNQKGASSDEVFASLGYSKAYLNKANKEALAAARQVEEITRARQQALSVGARNFPKELGPLDHELSDMSHSSADKISSEEKVELQSKYIALELSCIKHNKLGTLRKLLKEADDKHATKITPKAYADAVTKFNIADKMIETDRHSNLQIDTVVSEATSSANRVLSLLASEQNSRGQSAEQRAVALETKDNAVKAANSQTFAATADGVEKDHELAQQDLIIAAQKSAQARTEDENSELKRKETDEKMVVDAAAKFSPTEAEVYRQGDLLIIRLKSMNFASGRSDLPSDSMNVLSKVKSIIVDLGAKTVMVQGHTDSLGLAKANLNLSEKRAESVMKYFATGHDLDGDDLGFAGFGYSKPLATNKTKEGRAQNRRVDVLITTNH